MAMENINFPDQSESNPLLSETHEEEKKMSDQKPAKVADTTKTPASQLAPGTVYGWTADGHPLDSVSVMGEPVGRAQWDSSLFSCLGHNDEFCGSDVEVCLLGSIAPCVLYGSNAERLGSGTFSNHCMPYTALYLLGNSLFGWNFLAPWFSYQNRSAIRRKFNLEGSWEALSRSSGCCGSSMAGDELQHEQCEQACDLATHMFCHICALCQEGRELRRRMPHPGFNAQPVLVMLPPGEQNMGR